MVCTYNSARRLSSCLASIVKNIPVKTLWIIDKYSEDGTVEIAKSYGANIVQTNRSLAESRKLGFNTVETPLFVNVDSDVVLCENWFDKMMRFWNDNRIGCVWGVDINQAPLHKAYVESMYRIRRPETYNIPHLSNMVAKKDVLKDIVFPQGLRSANVANEDWLIKRWIEAKGFRCVTVPVHSKHYSYPPQSGEKAFWYGASVRFSKITPLRNIVLRFALSFPQGVFSALCSQNPRVIPYWVKFKLNNLRGFLNYTEFYDFKRE